MTLAPTVSEEDFRAWLDSHRTRQPPRRPAAPRTRVPERLTQALVTLHRRTGREAPSPDQPPPPLLP